MRIYNTLSSPYGKLKGFYISIGVEYMLNQFLFSFFLKLYSFILSQILSQSTPGKWQNI